MQVGGAVGVHDALRLAGGAAGVAQAHGGRLFNLRPVIDRRMTLNKVFIVYAIWEA